MSLFTGGWNAVYKFGDFQDRVFNLEKEMVFLFGNH